MSDLDKLARDAVDQNRINATELHPSSADIALKELVESVARAYARQRLEEAADLLYEKAKETADREGWLPSSDEHFNACQLCADVVRRLAAEDGEARGG